jgi:MucB/RseB N-terminal domain
MFALAAQGLIAAALGGNPASSDEILARVVDRATARLLVPYSGLRVYKLRNKRFDKQARVSVRMTYRPSEGKRFTVLERSGSERLTAILDRILASEAEESRPSKITEHEIGPENYRTYLRGTERVNGRPCYVIGLKPRHKSKYLIEGTLWVDSGSFGVVRLDGSTAASVSIWVGSPRITEEFTEIAGLWLPSYVRSVSSGIWLGTSELEIHYTSYQVGDIERGGSTPAVPAAKAATGHPGSVSAESRAARAPAVTWFKRCLYLTDNSRNFRVSRGHFALVVTPKNGAQFTSPKSLMM